MPATDGHRFTQINANADKCKMHYSVLNPLFFRELLRFDHFKRMRAPELVLYFSVTHLCLSVGCICNSCICILSVPL
jgi:hypothetical protein